jgi:adenine deaminase
MFKEMDFLSAHQSSNPICPATESVSPICCDPEAGMTPADVIVAATSRAAEFLGTMDRGSLVPGKRADFPVLDANPLDDIRNTRRIAKMYLSGVEVDRAALRESLTRNAGPR